MKDIKKEIQDQLFSLQQGDLYDNSLRFFETLGYNTQRRNRLETPDFFGFEDRFLQKNAPFSQENALTEDWKSIELLFQLTDNEVRQSISLFQNLEVNNTLIESYVFFAIELKGAQYNRTALSKITREINRIFPMPVMVFFRYGEVATLAMIHRRIHKKDREKDVLEKVTLLKDIRLANPHRAHLDILADLQFQHLSKHYNITNFVELHNAWQKVFDIKELNKRFYKELFDWYLWAVRLVKFPKPENEILDDHSHQSISVIRLLTRLIFVWFIKEKNLLNPSLFDTTILANLLNDFKPEDVDSAAYYQGILQNLFFATLNSPMTQDAENEYEKRQFVEDLPTFQGKNEAYNDKSKYRGRELFDNSRKQKIITLLEETPFLNGGLFECLDWKDEETNKEVRYDGFSTNVKKRAFVPNILFFGKATIDLSKELDDKKRKEVPVKGIIDILKSYKFTIAENTPLEEEIALDPELLGKVFENLLASYNPETQSSARKQTGSFYTPREIVDYMVAESLKAYFKEKLRKNKPFVVLGEKQTDMFGNEVRKQLLLETTIEEAPLTEAEIDHKLSLLFSYEQSENPFDTATTHMLIEALSDCKILDPACGSGAYPMGVLNTMVHILTKLDGNNVKWKTTLLKKAEKDFENAQKFEDEVIRKQAVAAAEIRIQYIKDSFAKSNHELDYTRKLFLIENCIYGVDIQQIAVQISKLRFFISLIVEQSITEGAKNRGILSMPNLETKFVAANTLIGLEKNDTLISYKVIQTEKALDEKRKEIFFVKRWKDKKKLKEQEKKIRQQLKIELIDSGFGEKTATQKTSWNPFDVIHSASFFDKETMFGEDLKLGFDIVIGNPPYIDHKKLKDIVPLFTDYRITRGTSDLYVYFYEKGAKLLSHGGILNYITSNKWLRSDYGTLLRGFVLEKMNPLYLIDFGTNRMFDATVDCCIFIVQNLPNKYNFKISSIDNLEKRQFNSFIHGSFVLKNDFSKETWLLYSGHKLDLKNKIEKRGIPLNKHGVNFFRGILTGNNGVFIINKDKANEFIALDKNNQNIIVPILKGDNIEKYRAKHSALFLINTHNGLKAKGIERVNVELDYPVMYNYFLQYKTSLEKRSDKGSHWTNLRNCTYLEEFKKEKIIWQSITKEMFFSYSNNEVYCDVTTFFMTGKNLKYLLAILNSKLVSFCLLELYLEGDTFKSKNKILQDFPVPQISHSEQQPFIRLVEYILWLKTQEFADVQDRFMSVYFEQVIDGMVYELYFREELETSGTNILRYLHDIPSILASEQKLPIIQREYKRLYASHHPVRNALVNMSLCPSIKLIEQSQA